MATKTVDFQVGTKDGINGCWIAVDDIDVPLANGSASARLETGEHLLMWWMAGNPGGSISISGKVGNKEVVSVKSSRIRDGSTKGGGRKYFDV